MSARFDIHIELSPGLSFGLIVASLFLCAPAELASESLTLTTYYPSPLGVYRQVVTTGAGGANTMLARDGGSVGIGTAKPGAELDVYSSYDPSATPTASFAAPKAGPNVSRVQTGANGDWYVRSASAAGKVVLQDTGGSVGVGTSAPGAQLDVYSTASPAFSPTAQFSAPGAGGNVSKIHAGSSGDWYIRSAASGGKVILQDTGGSVGVLTSTPSYPLDVNGDVRFQQKFQVQGTSQFNDYIHLADTGRCSLMPFAGGGWDYCPAGTTYATWIPAIWQDGNTYQRWPSAPNVGGFYAFQLYSASLDLTYPGWRSWSFDLMSGSMYCCQ